MSSPSIVLFSADTLRFDCLGYQPERRYLARYGASGPFMPVLDQLAAGAARFTQAVSVASYTTTAHASLLSGLYPPANGVRAFYATRLAPGTPTLAALLREQGYATLALSDTPELFEPLGLFAGFQRRYRAGEDERFLADLQDAMRAGPTFGFVHAYDAHDPYLLREGPTTPSERGEFLGMVEAVAREYGVGGLDLATGPHRLFRALLAALPGGRKPGAAFAQYYFRGVQRFDTGRLARYLNTLDAAGLLRDGVFALLADHGEAEVDGNFDHWGPLVDEVVRVPFILHAPGRVPAASFDGQVSLVDVLPTLLDLAGLPWAPRTGPAGSSLLPRLRGEAVGQDSLGYGEFWSSDGRGGPDGLARLEDGAAWLPATLTPMPRRHWWPEERMLRSPMRKLIVRGPFDDVALATRPELNDYEFVAALHAAVVGYRPEPEKLERESGHLAAGSVSREQLLELYLAIDETSQRPRIARYDLQFDPFEERPLVKVQSARDLFELGAQIATIARLSAEARPAPPLVAAADRATADVQVSVPPISAPEQPAYTAEEEEVVAQRLRDLGYL